MRLIRLTKAPEPGILKNNKIKWTKEYQGATANPATAPQAALTRYRHRDIKNAIVAETHEKCAYCESKVSHVYPGDIEHMLPKSRRPDLVVEWSNLTFACAECNRRKSDYYDPALLLLDPYIDDPANHVDFAGPMIFHRPGAHRGRKTVSLLELNRAALFERRSDRLQGIVNLLDVWRAASAGSERNAIEAELLREAAEDSEYSAAAGSFLRHNEIR